MDNKAQQGEHFSVTVYLWKEKFLSFKKRLTLPPMKNSKNHKTAKTKEDIFHDSYFGNTCQILNCSITLTPMGLLYLFPTSLEETEFVTIDNKTTPSTLKVTSYGLPWIFWIYAGAALLVLSMLTYSIIGPVKTLYEISAGVDRFLIGSLLVTIILTYLSVILFLYWRLLIIVTPSHLYLEYRPFGLKIYRKAIEKDSSFSLEVKHFMDSPNLARLHKDDRYKSFQNSGYFELYAINSKRKILLDRSSRKQDLEDLKALLLKIS